MASDSTQSGLGDVCLRITKGTTPTTIGGRFTSSGIAFVKVESITADGRLDAGKFAYIDEETNRLLARSVLQEDDLLFTIAGSIGRVARVPEAILPANTNQAVAIIRPDKDLVDSRFLFYALRDERVSIHAQSRVVQSVQANFSLSELSSIEVPLPSLSEQRRIAVTLGALDDKIESNNRIASHCDSLAAALAEQLVAQNATRHARLGEFVSFNDDVMRRGSIERIRYIDIASVSPGKVDAVQDLLWAEAPSRARRGVADGDVIFSTVRPGRRAFAQMIDPSPATVASTGFVVMRPSRRLGSSFLTWIAASTLFAGYLESVAHGSAYPAVSVEAISNFELDIPDIDAMDDFELDTMPLRRRAAHARRESRSLANLRDSLIPELLSGRLRVPEARDAVEIVS